jgi:L-ascorbate metabolism protein UlaG (beta-lactamase superfamily)
MKKKKIAMLIAILSTVIMAASAYAWLARAEFGAVPMGLRLLEVERSPHYQHGEFQNLVETQVDTGNSSFFSNLLSFVLDRNPRLKPATPLPSVQTDLKSLSLQQDLVIWLGHSSFYIQLNGKRILIDPVFSTNASPVPHTNSAFKGSMLYTAQDMPDIDVLLITHDHWDHLDYASIRSLRTKVSEVVTGLGVGAHLVRWGYKESRIHEADWNDEVSIADGLKIFVLPARHFSGRWLKRNQTLWVSFALESPERRLYFSGDSGYGPHFREIGKKFNGFDLVALDMGQYDHRWANIHMFPEEAAQAADELGARALMPAHVGRFSIAAHDWDEPFNRIQQTSRQRTWKLLTPEIGEAVDLSDQDQTFKKWWKSTP